MRKQLPKGLPRKARISDDKIAFSRTMLPRERDALKALYTREASKQKVDELFLKCQTATHWVDWGSELIPAAWHIKGAQEMDASPTSPTLQRRTSP
jgi:hypothetical protein